MPEVRDQEDSAQRNEAQRWIKNVVVVILVALLLFVLFKERHDSRKLLEELSNRLAKTEKESENLRKELDVTKAKVDKMLERFPNVQKVTFRFTFSNLDVIMRVFPAVAKGHQWSPHMNGSIVVEL